MDTKAYVLDLIDEIRKLNDENNRLKLYVKHKGDWGDYNNFITNLEFNDKDSVNPFDDKDSENPFADLDNNHNPFKSNLDDEDEDSPWN